MKNAGFAGVLIVAVASVALFVEFGTAEAQKKGEKRAATTKQLMKGLVFANCKALGGALNPKEGKEVNWEDVALKAAMLNEASYVLMADKRCPSGEWAKGAKTIRGCSVVVLEKAKAKDLEGAKGAFKALTAGCATCHKAHKGK